MSDHLPECCEVDQPGYGTWWCICDRLRACEQRVNSSNLTMWNHTQEEAQHMINAGLGMAWKDGFKEGMDATRKALLGLRVYGDHGEVHPVRPEDAVVYRHEALAAIDALREGEK